VRFGDSGTCRCVQPARRFASRRVETPSVSQPITEVDEQRNRAFLRPKTCPRAICACRRMSSARRCRRCWSSRDSPGSGRWPRLKSSMNAAATADGSSSRTCSVMTSACS